MKTKSLESNLAADLTLLRKELKVATATAASAQESLVKAEESIKLKDQQITFLVNLIIAIQQIINSPAFQETLGSGKLWKIITGFSKVIAIVKDLLSVLKVFRDNVKFEQDEQQGQLPQSN